MTDAFSAIACCAVHRRCSARVAHIQALVEALGATADNDNIPAFDKFAAVGEFAAVHKSAFAELRKLVAQAEGIKVISHC